MNRTECSTARWTVVVIYATAMAWVESAVVFYLRTMIDRIDPYQPHPLPISGGFAKAEIVREIATIVMLAAVGLLAGRNFKSRVGYFLVGFGVWDIAYYVFLRVLTGWPNSLMNWDLLFLLPLPWWGPVWAPVAIALLMIAWGTITSRTTDAPKVGVSLKVWALAAVGSALALYVFMVDSIQVWSVGGSLRHALPTAFPNALFLLALALMSLPLFAICFPAARSQNPLRMEYAKWLSHFKRNRENRIEPDWSATVSIRPAVLAPLLRSLVEFQLGDGGGPASLIAFDAEHFRNRSDDLRSVVDAWFAEEREHARLLGCAVDRFGGQRITSHWSFTAFCGVRRVLGVKFELQVLLLTELVSTAYYRVLRRHVPDEPVAAMCQLILRDEAGHVAFHRDRLAATRSNTDGMLAAFWEMQFWFFGHAAATVLWMSHGKCLTVIGGSRAEYFAEVRYELARFTRALACETEPYAMLAVTGK